METSVHSDMHSGSETSYHIGDVELTVKAWGTGSQAVVLLHGFPDTAASMEPMALRLTAHGYRVFAPYLRGYAPSSLSPDGCYDLIALAEDIEGLIETLEIEDCILVGHDWGAVIAYAVSARQRVSLRTVFGLSVPPVAKLLRNGLRSPSQWWLSHYMLKFQVNGIAEMLVRRKNFKFIETLWARWSPGWEIPEHRLAEVKTCLASPGTLTAALSFYRSLRPGVGIRRRNAFRLMLMAPKHSTVCLVGTQDRCIQAQQFQGLDYPVIHIPNAGHFLHLEAPERVAQSILDMV